LRCPSPYSASWFWNCAHDEALSSSSEVRTMNKLSERTPAITGHYFNKHQSSNPLVQVLVNRYRRTLQRLVVNLPVHSALEIGSGEGHILSYIREVRPDIRSVGSDITSEIVQRGRMRVKTARWCVARAERLPFHDNSLELVVACEVLEHVVTPEVVLTELRRLSGGYCIVSVPNEPLWRVLNVARGKYLRDWGNTPGHIHHWSRASIAQLVGQYFDVIEVASVLPWTFVLARGHGRKILQRDYCLAI
jgi:ubiquinone/menaquinone biosynthesis C-methylase UbiE